MVNVTPEITQPTETQRAEVAANGFYEMASRAREEEAQYPPEERYKEDMFSDVGRKTAQGNLHRAQYVLERGVQWDDKLRGAACEINQLDQERTGAKPMSFEEALKTINGYARGFEEMAREEPGRSQSDLEGAAGIDNIIADASEPGIEGIDQALRYIEGTLKSHVNLADFTTYGTGRKALQDWQEKRSIRDALYREKQRRIEQMKLSQQSTASLTMGRKSTTSTLEHLYDEAGVPEDTASRQGFFARLQRMSEQELRLLNSALQATAAEFGKRKDPKMLDGLLMNLSTQSFKLRDVQKRMEAEDQIKLQQARAELGLEEAAKTPINEASKQGKEKTTNPFQGFVDSPETYLDRLRDDDGPNTYSPKRVIGAVLEVLQDLYPDNKQRANRIQEILGQFSTLRDKSRRDKPNIDESTHGYSAINQTAQRLSDVEQRALEKIIERKINITQHTFAGKSKMRFTKEYVLGSFIDFLEGIKQ